MTTRNDINEHMDAGEIANRLRVRGTLIPSGMTWSSGAGAPTAAAGKGSLYIDTATGILYSNTSGSTTWTKVSGT